MATQDNVDAIAVEKEKNGSEKGAEDEEACSEKNAKHTVNVSEPGETQQALNHQATTTSSSPWRYRKATSWLEDATSKPHAVGSVDGYFLNQ